MTQQEFEKRTQCAVNAETFAIINRLYMATDMYKDDFCKEFKAMNDPTSGGIRQSLQEISIRLGVLEDKNANLKESIRQRNSDLTDFLIGKAHAYDDTDFRFGMKTERLSFR